MATLSQDFIMQCIPCGKRRKKISFFNKTGQFNGQTRQSKRWTIDVVLIHFLAA